MGAVSSSNSRDAAPPAGASAGGAAAAAGASAAGAGAGGGGVGVGGTGDSCPLAGLLPSAEVKLREGNKTEAVACPAAKGALTYAKVLERPDFKEYLYRHLDSDELVSSVLTENATDDQVLLLGIHLMQQLSGDKKEQHLEQIAAFDDLVAVGMRVDLPETQSVIEKELQIFNRAQSSPFLRAFQRRIAVLLNCKDSIAIEQRAAKEQRRPRVYATSDLTTCKYPQLQLLDSLKITGINMLLLFPICFPLLASPEEQKLFSVPIEELCARLGSLSDLELFSSWSPGQRPLQSPIKLKLSSARASDGNASHAIDGKLTTFWSTKKTASSFWSVQIEQPCICTSIKIAWRSVTPTSFHFAGVSEDVGAPKVLIISMQYLDAIAESSTTTEYEDAFVVKPDQERIKQGSWEQVYTLPHSSSNSRLVSSIKLSMVRPAASNTTGFIKIHSFQVFSSTPKMKWVDSLSLMTSLQDALYPIAKRFPEMQSCVFPAITAIIRSSGSLKLALILIREMLSGDFPSTVASSVREFQGLVLQEHKRVAQRMSSTVDVPQPDTIFDKDSKSSQVKISEEGFRINYELVTGSVPTTSAYCMLNCVMGYGQTWVWEFSAFPSSLELDGCYFGVAKRPITDEDYQVSSDYYVVRCSNGDLYHDGKIPVPSEGAFLPRILSSDVCKFTYDASQQTLSLMINDNDFGVLFRDVQPGISPVVLFTGEGQVAKSRSIRLKQTAIREQCVVSEKEFDVLQETMAALINTASDSSSSDSALANRSVALHLLKSISCLAQIRMEELIREEASKEKKRGAMQSILEYPCSVEVSADVISSLVDLLQSVTSSPDESGKSATISILRILDSQFYCLTKAGVDPETVGFPDKDVHDSVAKTAAMVVLTLTDSADKEVQLEASKVYARGAVLFLRTVVEKIDLVLTLIREPGSEIVEPDTSRFLILAMIIKHLSKIDDVLEIFAKLKSRDHSFEMRLVDFIAGLLRIVSEINILHIKSFADAVLDDKDRAMDEFQNVICKLLQRFQEHLMFELTTKAVGATAAGMQQDCWSPAFMNVLVAYSKLLVVNSERVLSASNEASLEPVIGWSASQRRLRNSIVPLLLQPLLHSFVICKDNLPLVARLLPQAVNLLEITTRLCRLSKPCADAASLIFASIQRKIPRMTSATEQSGMRGGWKVIKAVFESGEASYSVTEDGLVYTSQSQSNTCGIINIGFSSSQRAAWEFQLLADTLGDECSLFGAARLPLTSRCYNNSPDLWMRRSYNGHMYCQGRTTTMSPPLDRIHPGDIVRIEFDGKAQTLSYSVNGKELELGFSEVSDTVYPSCGSYRPGVSIRLIKVEIYKDFNSEEEDEPYSASTVINWNVTSPDNENRAPDNILRIIVAKDAPVPGPENWLSAQTDRGVDRGIHSWSFEFSEVSRSPYGVGVVVGAASLEHRIKLATRALLGSEISEAAWYSDGTLWCNGNQVAENFGTKFLPLERLSVVSMNADLVERTISFSVDGEFVGIAFGPAGSNASAAFPLPAKQGEGKSTMVFPAASVSSASQMIRISTAGFNGSCVLPLQLSLQKASASVIGRLSAALLAGAPVDKKEAGLLPLLQSSLLIGGLEPTSAGFGINALSWREMWARQKTFQEADLPMYSDEAHPLYPVSENENEAVEFLATISDFATSADGATQRSSLFNWLELINPEPPGQRSIMERLHSYSFPICEYPLLACLLKHAGLTQEAIAACKVMKENSGTVPIPSAEMVTCWKTVQQLRRFLRSERQKLKSLLASDSSSTWSSPPLASPPFGEFEANEGEGTLGDAAVAGGGISAVEQLPAETIVINQENASLFFGNSASIAWCRQPRSVEDPSTASFVINAVGIDADTSFVFVRISLENRSDVALEASCSLYLDGALDPSTSASDAEFVVLERCGHRLVGCFRIDVAAHDLFERIVAPTSDVRFTGGLASASLTSVLLQIPTFADAGVSLEDLKERETAEKITSGQALPLFSHLCARIESKIRFLLGVAVASSSNLDVSDEKRKQQHCSDAFQRQSSAAEPGNDGQERWKRVIDFLRVHSQIRKQASQEHDPSDSFGERSPLRIDTMRLHDRLGRPAEADYDSDLENTSSADSSMQACYLFAITEGAHSSLTCLEEILLKRLNRAEQRIFAMQALHSVMSLPDAFSDPFCMEELLLFVRASFTASPHRGGLKQQLSSEKVHYLVNLESCPTVLLLRVQQSFAQLFSGISRFVAQYADTWDALSQRACVTLGGLNKDSTGVDPGHHAVILEARDSHLALGPLRLLLSLWTLSYSNRDHKFIMECGLIPSLHKMLHLATFERVVEMWYTSGLKLVEYYSLHCERFKDTKKWVPLPSSFINSRLKSGSLSSRTIVLHLLLMPFKEISEDDRDRMGLESSFQLLCATLGAADVSLLNLKVSSLIRFREETEEREKNKKDATEAAAKATKDAETTARLSLCGVFDSAHKEASITLSDFARVAVLNLDDASSADPANVYATVCYDCDAGMVESGNYFEIEIITLSGGDFGIGLADRDTVAIDSGLGTTASSYCYRGDNGTKLGVGATPAVWLPFQQGDVIGCGYDMISRSIYYTRNGEFLGVAFDGVAENKLWPIVGSFASSGSDVPAKVRVNFGIESFRFSGSDGVVMSAIPIIATNRAALHERILQLTQAEAEQRLASEAALAASVRSGRRSRASTMEINVDGSIEDLMAVTEEEYRSTLDVLTTNLRSASAYLFEFNSLRAYCNSLLRFILVNVCECESLPMGVKPRSDELVSQTRTLLKQRSVFGTPKFLTFEDGLLLREGLVAAMVHQLLLGATYLSTAQPSIGNVGYNSLSMNQTPPQGHGKSIKDIQAAQLGGASESAGSLLESSSSIAVLEVLEVEKHLYELLSTLSVLLSINKSLKNQISKGMSLATLFLLLQHGSLRIKSLATILLRKILPDVSPAEGEAALSEECKASLAKSEDSASPPSGSVSGARRQKRRIPDGVVRLLLLKAMESLSLSDESGPHPLGYGDMALTIADQNVSLVQHLFDAPMWTELVACNITDAFRRANAVVESLRLDEPTPVFDEEQRTSVLAACAACTVLSGLGTLRPGSAIIGTDGTKGILIKLHETEQRAFVLFNKAAENAVIHVSDVESVDRNSIKAVRSCVHVDLSRLSQPLLPQLTTLMKGLLEKTSFSATKQYSGSDALLMRLSYAVSNAISTLLDRQPDLVIDATHDAKVIGNIIRMSLLPCGLDKFASANSLTRMWNQMQARVLERSSSAEEPSSVSELTSDARSSSERNEELAVADSLAMEVVAPAVISSSDPISLAIPELVRMSAEPSSPFVYVDDVPPVGRQQAAATLVLAAGGGSEHMARNSSIVQQRLDYFMGDALRATASLVEEVLLPQDANDMDEGWFLRQDAASPNPVEFSSENILMSADNQLEGSSEAPYYPTSLIEMTLSSIVYRSTPASQGRTPTNLPPASYVIECDSEGPLLMDSKRKKIGMTADKVVGGKDVIVSYFDSSLGLPMFVLVDTSSLKIAHSFFDKKCLSIQEMCLLDQTCTILRLRRIAAKLLIEGNLNLNHLDHLEDWERFVKLAAVTTMQNLDVKEDMQRKRSKILSSLCSSLIARSRSSLASPETSLGSSLARQATFDGAIVAALVRGITDTFAHLTSSSICLSRKSRDKETPVEAVDEILHCSSPHPFVAPFTTKGKFQIPPDWKGVMVSFHPKCATPSKLAKLEFFKSAKSFEEDKPAYSYSGPSNSFRPFILTDSEWLYFRFRAAAGADRPMLGVVQLEGQAKIDYTEGIDKPHSSVSMRRQFENRDPVGLGEDDSLFNLFDEGSRPEVPASTLVAADFEPLTQGCWFFEVVVDAVSSASFDFTSSDRVGLCASSSASSLGTVKNSCAFASSGHVVNEGLDVSGDLSLGAWAVGDILGCVFDLSAEYRVRFARNGTWSEPICGLVDETFAGFRVAFSIGAPTKLSPNFGEVEFKFAPSHEIVGEWKCLLARPFPEVKELAWGYHFCVKPLRELHMKVTRGIELIAHIKPDDGHRGADTPKGIWVWRAKSADNFTGCGDVVTTDCRVPRGAIIVDKSQCAFPTTFKKVLVLSKSGAGGVTLWRPVPPSSDYVALGDIVVANTSLTPPPPTTVLCVPRWAVNESSPGAKVYKSKRGGTDAAKGHSVSVWMNRCAMGTFFGSPFDRRVCDDATKKEDSEVNGIGVPYSLSRDVGNDISGEWRNDEDVCRGSPSLSWSAELLDFLLENVATRTEVLTPDTFSMLVKYATSSSSPAPLVVIPLMIKMIRMAREAGVELPLNSIDGLCKSILKKAQNKSISASSTGFTLSNSLVRLVDLVVETQSAQVAAAAIKDMEAAKADRGEDTLSLLGPAPAPAPALEPVENAPLALVKTGDNSLSSLAVPGVRSRDASRPWWDREGRLSHSVLEAASAISLSNVKSIFIKDQLIRRLKQVLIFLAAMGATPGLMTYRDPASPDTVIPVTCRYPKLIVAKVWHDYASVCTFVESDHPYKVGKFEKRISFPGAEKLRIMVDSRTTLGPGATLSLTVGLTKIQVTSSATTMNLQGNELLISFDVAALEADGLLQEPVKKINYADDWGWAIVVHASGPLFESSSVTVEFDPVDESAWPTKNEDKSDSLLGPLIPTEPLSDEVPELVLDAAGPKLLSALAGGSSSKSNLPGNAAKKNALQSHAEERVIELVTASGACGNRGKIAVPHASEVEVKLSRPHPGADDATFVRVVVVDYKCQTGDEAAEQQVVKVLLPASKSHTVKFSVKTSTIGYCVYSLTRAFLDAMLAAEDAAKRALASDQAAEEVSLSEAAASSGEDPSFIDPSLWCCEQCTYVNAVEAHTCEICGFLHSTLAWSCAGCTFVNVQSNRNCAICATPRHPGPPVPGLVDDEEDEEEEDEDISDDDDYSGEAGAGLSPSSKAAKESSPEVVVETRGAGAEAGDANKKDVLVISLKGKLSNEETFLSRLEGALCSDDARAYTPREMQEDMKKWGSVEDAVLLEFINAERRGISSESGLLVNPGKLILPKKAFMYHPNSKLASFNLLDIQCRMLVLEAFNKALNCILPIINLQSNDAQSIGATLRRHNRYVFMSVKEPTLERALQASCTPTGTPGVPAALSLDNIKALMSRDKGEVELTQSQCCFAQAFRQLRDKDSLVFRYIFSGDRVFSITFNGESGIDAGGVGREVRAVLSVFLSVLLSFCP